MGQDLHYLQWLDKKLLPIILKILAILSIIVLIAAIYSNYYGAIIWEALYGHYRAFRDIWLPSLPGFLFWLAMIYCGWKDKRLILWGFPLIVYFYPYKQSIEYIIRYHTDMGSLYYPGQILALFNSTTVTLGLITLGLHIFIRLKQNTASFNTR